MYDFWLVRPPDWEQRREAVLQYLFFCDDCGALSERGNPLQIHHKIPISKGGNHTLANLILLCKECHQNRHGVQEFSKDDKIELGAFGKKMKILRIAVDNKEIVRFSYQKFEGNRSVRAIIPNDFIQVGKSLCVTGYCYLRNAERCFAIKRMRNVKIVKEPSSCYDI